MPKVTDAGKQRIFACTGLFIDWNGCTAVLTSDSLVLDFVKDNKIFEKLSVGASNFFHDPSYLRYCLSCMHRAFY
jgi:hypothetical protein